MVALTFVVPSETGELSPSLRERITAIEQQYRLRMGDFPIERFHRDEEEYKLHYMGVGFLDTWRIQRDVRQAIPEAWIEKHQEIEIGPFYTMDWVFPLGRLYDRLRGRK